MHEPRPRHEAREVHGVLVIDKPRGPTSHDVVARLRRALGTREVGHAGTLDPMATGVLVVLLGEGTKLAPYLTANDKAYEATIALGVATDTLDAEGQVVARADVPRSMREALEALRRGDVHPHIGRALDHERARKEQVPPAFSAIKTDGVRSYARARAGKMGDDAALPPRPVEVHALRVKAGGAEADDAWLTIEAEVAKGYYVRALARDLAASLGTVGHLTALRRTRSGPFTLDEAMPLDTPADELEARIIDVARAASRAMPTCALGETAARDARFGRALRPEDMGDAAPGPHAWLGPDGSLVAIGEIRADDGLGHVLRGFGGRGAT